MAMLRPSLLLVMNLDERVGAKETIQEVKRNYAHICTPVVRTHAEEGEDAPIRNTITMTVKLGTRKYLHSADEGADELWNTVVGPWIGNMLHKIGNNMKVFNKRQRKIGLPELHFDYLDIELQGGELTIGISPDATDALDWAQNAHVQLARELYDSGELGEVTRIEIPSAEAYEQQRAAAWETWEAEHPEPEEPEEPEEEEPEEPEEEEPAEEKTREQLLAEDIEAKSYENTHVAIEDVPEMERQRQIQYVSNKKEEEPERFNFEVDYALWTLRYADGSARVYDSANRSFTA